MIQGMNLLNFDMRQSSHTFIITTECKLYYVYAMFSQVQLSIIASQLSLDTNTYDFEYF